MKKYKNWMELSKNIKKINENYESGMESQENIKNCKKIQKL